MDTPSRDLTPLPKGDSLFLEYGVYFKDLIPSPLTSIKDPRGFDQIRYLRYDLYDTGDYHS